MKKSRASLIRDCLKLNPDGVDTPYVLLYCVEKGSEFTVKEYSKKLKCVAAQLSKMKSQGYVDSYQEGKKYIWSLK